MAGKRVSWQLQWSRAEKFAKSNTVGDPLYILVTQPIHKDHVVISGDPLEILLTFHNLRESPEVIFSRFTLCRGNKAGGGACCGGTLASGSTPSLTRMARREYERSRH